MATNPLSDTAPAEPAATVSFRTVLFSMVVLWATYFALTTFRSSLVLDLSLQLELGWRRLVITALGIGLTIVLWLLLRLFDAKPLWLKISAAIALAFPIALAIGQINQWIFKDMELAQEQIYAKKYNINLRRDESGNLLVDVPVRRVTPAGQPPAEDSDVVDSQAVMIAPAETYSDFWRKLLDVALGRYFLLLAWASTYFALLAGVQARSAQRREEQFRSAAKAAELRSLRYQVNPHFLFNTLNSLSALVMTGKAESAERMIQTISRFYRHSLATEPTADVSLRDEFDLQKLYLDIETVRFPTRLVTQFDLPADLEECRVPGMILQPLVENSVKYAVSPVSRPVTITVAAREEFDRLVITVGDDGPGVPQGTTHGFGIGLANVRDRLEARFGPDIGFSSAPTPGGYCTEIRIPLSRPATRHA